VADHRPYRRLVRPPTVDGDRLAREVGDELAFHVAERADELVRLGQSRAQAEQQARAEFGDLAAAAASVLPGAVDTEHTIRRGERVGDLLRDLRLAWRGLRRDRAFSAGAVTMLAIGIGASATLFSVVHAVLLRPLPYANASRSVVVWNAYPQSGLLRASIAAAEFADMREGLRTMSVAGMRPARMDLGGDCGPAGAPCLAEEISAWTVSPDLLSSLGVRTALGRGFTTADGAAGAAPVAILGHALWERRFAADSAVLGRPILLGGQSRIVVGVLPRAVRFPEAPLGYLRERADVWLPYDWMRDRAQGRGNQVLGVLGFLRPGTRVGDVQVELDALAARFRTEYPDRYGRAGLVWHIAARPLRDEMIGDVRKELALLVGAVGLLLAIACVNVAGLLLARGTARVREMAVRRALGAGRSRLVRQLLAESLLLAGLGAAVGLAIATACTRALVLLDADRVPRLGDTTVNGVVLLACISLAAACTVLFGMLPALRQSNSPFDALREGPNTAAAGPPRPLLRALVAGEVALTIVLLACAGLVGRSFARLNAIDTGIRQASAVTFQVSLPRIGYDSAWKLRAFHATLAERLAAAPAIGRFGAVYPLPMSGDAWSGTYHLTAQPEDPGEPKPHAEYAVATPGYFAAMGIDLVAGREFDASDADGGRLVAIVDEVLARRHWPDRSPIGECINPNRPAGTCATIVGVVRHVRTAGPRHAGEPQIYVPMSQRAERKVSYVATTSGNNAAAFGAIRQAVNAVDPQLPVSQLRPWSAVARSATARERFLLVALAAFAFAALVLAGFGLFGVMSYTVARQHHEIGVRLALGAAGRDIVRLVLRSAMRTVAGGIVIGVPVAIAVGGFLDAYLFGIGPTDPVTLAGVLVLLIAVSLVAAWVPARRAGAVDPLLTLRR